MKVLVISDIHANMLALDRVWAKERDSDLVVCAGDLVDFGFEPNAVVDWVRQHAHHCVFGNHDTAVCAKYEAIHHDGLECDGTIVWHNAHWLTADSYNWLKQLPHHDTVTLGDTEFGLVHQFGKGYELPTTWQQFAAFAQQHWQRDLKGLIFGHSHRPEAHTFMHSYHWLNPGSVSYRKDDDPSLGAHYMVVIDGQPEWRFIEGDYHAYYKQFESLELTEQQRCRVGWKYRAMADMHASPADWPTERTV